MRCTPWFAAAVLSVLSMSVTACGGDGDGPAGLLNGNSGMSAQIDGENWTASETFVYRHESPLMIVMTGRGGGREIQFLVSGPTIGTHVIDGDAPESATMTHGGGGWTAGGAGGSGSITLTAFTESRVAGTFAFTVVPIMGEATGTREVTNGVFDITY